ncbi:MULTISPECIES: Crp/Fnr family transcriptional regulator [Sphingobacterium]|uniref:Crp/Fnr family transcriptional regulator n=1 Tax=Sphingobacterium TaxID=28453 RepID=UPI00191A9C21|nr:MULTISPECIES: Crp/Fnr family transcriptional regulator [Sphingobacterium]QQT26407.1 Crp/Fnr family transcriptional regulator [Sphingobacterium spiritivorum]
MKVDNIANKLKNANLFDKTVILRRHEFLCLKDAIDQHIYWIDSGGLRIFMMDGEEERNIRFGYSDNLIVSLDSFLSGNPTDFYIQAIRKTTVRIANKSSLQQFIQSAPDNFILWNQILEDLILQQVEREKDILISSPRERYERILKRSPRLFQEIPNKYIANYLRMSPETLSRLQKS